jgi:hypothetical protein
LRYWGCSPPIWTAGNASDKTNKLNEENAKREQEASLLDWQKVVVYGIIAQKGFATLAEIRDPYLSEAIRLGLDRLPHEKLQDLALHAVLLKLVETGSVVVLPDSQTPPKRNAICRSTSTVEAIGYSRSDKC